MSRSAERNEKLETALKAAGINFKQVSCIGDNVTIWGYKKYRNKLIDLMSQGGFALFRERDGIREALDGIPGYRIDFMEKTIAKAYLASRRAV